MFANAKKNQTKTNKQLNKQKQQTNKNKQKNKKSKKQKQIKQKQKQNKKQRKNMFICSEIHGYIFSKTTFIKINYM